MKTKLIFLFGIFLGLNSIFSQTKLADKFFDNYGYVKAIEFYQKAINNGEENTHTLTRLGDAYYNTSNPKEASKWYRKAIVEYGVEDTEYLFKYIQSLRSIGNYEEANKWYEKLIKAYQSQNIDYVDIDVFNSITELIDETIELNNIELNTENSEFGAYEFNNILYFASSREKDGKIYGWNKEPFLNIYQSTISNTSDSLNFEKPTKIDGSKINTKYHEASIAITNDGNTMYFTRVNVSKSRKLQSDAKGTTHLKIYRATKDGDRWGKVKELSINDDVFSNGHPALSPDNKTLYFISDRKGGFGHTDIYSVEIKNDGSLGKPVNLGDKINTNGKEMFPYVAKDSTLYFSSDGFANLGLLDIYKSNILKDNNAIAENLGAPYNSGQDDFAFFINSETNQGYLSSNRPGGKGGDDIYAFGPKRICKKIINGTVKDKFTEELLTEVTVRLIDEEGVVLEELNLGENSNYSFEIECDKKYIVTANKDDYKDDKIEVVITEDNSNEEEVTVDDLELEPLIRANEIVINPIFFDYDEYEIRTDAQFDLENIVDVLNKHPKMVIRIEAHTDSRGFDDYNLELSDKRAKATRDYIISRGINPRRIASAKGFGETQPLNKCVNDVECTEEEHQVNRRSYFYIVSY